MSKKDYEKLLNVAIDAAKLAGDWLKKKTAFKLRTSDERDIKIDADVESECLIIEKLEKYFPVLSEERGGDLSKTSPTWIVDPLDGTVNYARGIPISCVSICLWDEGPRLGVIYDFVRNELFTGIVGHGATMNGKEITVSAIKDRSMSIIFTGFPISMSFKTHSLGGFIKLVQRYKKVRMIGSAALSLAYVSCGRGDVYLEHQIRLWDVAAGLAILNAAGGSFQIMGGDPVDVYADNGVLIGVDE